MPLLVQIDKQGDLKALVHEHRDLMSSREGLQAAGVAASNRWREHFYTKNETPNQLGGKRTNFYAKAGDSVNYEVLGGQIFLKASALGLRQRYLGGTIKAKNRMFLTIPQAPQAHGKRAGEFSNLHLIRANRSQGTGTTLMLIKNKKDGSFEVYYILKKSVTQKADPTVVPEGELIEAARGGMMNLVAARNGRYN